MNLSLGFNIGAPPIELAGINTRGDIRLGERAAGGQARTLDANIWLPKAAEKYLISPNIRDYVVVPVPSIITSIPNTNGDSASLKELTTFQPEQGQMSYRTWVGKPTFEEHANKDYTQAKGVILDTYLRPLPRYPNFAKLVKLTAFDRTKDAALVQRILERSVNTYSMGMYYSSYICSICGHRAGKGIAGPCQHTRPGQRTMQLPDKRLAYRLCETILGFEISVVADPAYSVASSDLITDVSLL